MAIQPDVYPGRQTIKNPGQAPGPKTTPDPGHAPGQKAIQDPGSGPGQSLQDPGHLPRLPPPGTATDESMSDFDEDEILVSKFCVCLLRKDTTIVFLPCRHAKCCQECSIHLEKSILLKRD